MAVQMAKPTFITGPKDTLATVDVYKQVSNAVVNDTKNILNSVNFGSTGSLFGGKGMLSGLPLGGLNKLVSGGLTSITDRLGMTSGIMGKVAKSLSAAATKEISKLIPVGKINNLIATANSVVGGGNALINMAKSGNITGVLGAVNGIAQAAGIPGIAISDPKGMVALAAGLVTQGAKNGIPGVLTTLTAAGMIPDVKSMSKVVVKSIPTIIKSGSLDCLKEITKIAPLSMSALPKSTLMDFAKSFPVPELSKSVTGYTSDFVDVKKIFGDINTNWLTSPVPASTEMDFSCIMNGSPEFQKTITIGALNSDDPEDKWLLAAGTVSVPKFGMDFNFSSTPSSLSSSELEEGTTITSGGQDVSTRLEDNPEYIAWLKANPSEAYSKSRGMNFMNYMDEKQKATAPTPVERAATLYPAAAAMPAKVNTPVDPRAEAEAAKAKAIQAERASFYLPVRTLEELSREMTQERDLWATRLKEERGPFIEAANAANQAGNKAEYDGLMRNAREVEVTLETYFNKRIARIEKDMDTWHRYNAIGK